jgi:DNA replication and repair protein RecF
VRIGWVQAGEFRNYRTLSWSPSSKLNLLTGANAQGKTNLLEALGFLLTGRSFRTRRLPELPCWGASVATVAGELQRADGSRTVRRAVQRREDGVWASTGEGCEWARAVAFGWQDLEVMTGGPGARRNFIDGVAARLAPRHRTTLVRYRQVLARRNHLLQQGRGGALEPWDVQFVETGLELIDRRRRAAGALQTEVARIYPTLAGDRHKVEVQYRCSLGEITEPAAFLAALEWVRPQELRRGQTLLGPHRDDLALELDGVDARAFGSRGQQRLLALTLRLAEVLPVTEATGTPPVLLLDDALSELDPGVQENVLREIDTADQVFLTSPQPARGFGQPWRVAAGMVTAA